MGWGGGGEGGGCGEGKVGEKEGWWRKMRGEEGRR